MLTPDPVRLREVEDPACLGDRVAILKGDYMSLSVKRQGSLWLDLSFSAFNSGLSGRLTVRYN
jgi:hypothetical protein